MGLAYSKGALSIMITVGPGSTQADMVLEKELRVLHLDPKAMEEKLCATLNVV